MQKAGAEFLESLDIDNGILSAEEVGESAIKVIDSGKTASVWYIHKTGDDPYEVPNQNTYENLLKWKPA